MKPNWPVLILWAAFGIFGWVTEDFYTGCAFIMGFGVVAFLVITVMDIWKALVRSVVKEFPPTTQIHYVEHEEIFMTPPRHPDPTRPRDDEWPVIKGKARRKNGR